MEVVSERATMDAEARAILDAREKETKELKYEQKNALEILRKFVQFPLDKYHTLVQELNKITKLRERHIVMIANFLPQDKDDLRVLLHKDYTTFTEDEITLILETVKKTI